MTYFPPSTTVVGDRVSVEFIAPMPVSQTLSPFTIQTFSFVGGDYDIVLNVIMSKGSSGNQRLPTSRLLIDGIPVGLTDPNSSYNSNNASGNRETYTSLATATILAGMRTITIEGGSSGSQPCTVYAAKAVFRERV